MDRKSPSQVFKDYQAQLVQTLPMDDAIFQALLFKNNFFSGDKNATLNAKPTKADKALYFLNNIIGCDADSCFETLLNVMEVFGDSVAALAQEIKEKIGLKSCQGALYCMLLSLCVTIVLVFLCVFCTSDFFTTLQFSF